MKMAGRMKQTPTHPSHEICLSVRGEAPMPIMKAPHTLKATVHVAWLVMALRAIEQARIPAETMKILGKARY